MTVLKKDVIKSQSKDLDKGDEYRQILVQAIHSCAIKFPAVAANVILLLMGACHFLFLLVQLQCCTVKQALEQILVQICGFED